MYKTAVRFWIRRNIRLLNEGRYEPALKMFAADATLAFPGDNTWARQYREPVRGREAFVTHRGRDEIEGFLRRYVGTGMQMVVDDVLVNGPPWNLRAAARVHHWVARARWRGSLLEPGDPDGAFGVGEDPRPGRLRRHRARRCVRSGAELRPEGRARRTGLRSGGRSRMNMGRSGV